MRRDLLANGAFLRLWVAGALWVFGTHIGRVGTLLFLALSGSSGPLLAIVVMLEVLPGLLVWPVTGVIVDRVDRRRVLFVGSLAQAAGCIALAWHITVPRILIIVALRSLLASVLQPARGASVPAVVANAQLAAANALDLSGANLMLVVGPVAAAQILLHAGVRGVLIADAIAFGVGALLIAGLRLSAPSAPRESAEATVRGLLTDLRRGWGYVRGHRFVLHLTLLLFTAVVCTGTWAPLAPILLRDRFAAASTLLGWQLTVFGCGTVLGGVLAPLLLRHMRLGALLYAALLGEAFSLGLYGLASSQSVSTGILFVWGLIVSMIAVPFYTILQRVVEQGFLGRALTVVRLGENGAILVSMLVVLLVREAVGPTVVFVGTAGAYAVVTTISLLTKTGRSLATVT